MSYRHLLKKSIFLYLVLLMVGHYTVFLQNDDNFYKIIAIITILGSIVIPMIWSSILFFYLLNLIKTGSETIGVAKIIFPTILSIFFWLILIIIPNQSLHYIDEKFINLFGKESVKVEISAMSIGHRNSKSLYFYYSYQGKEYRGNASNDKYNLGDSIQVEYSKIFPAIYKRKE